MTKIEQCTLPIAVPESLPWTFVVGPNFELTINSDDGEIMDWQCSVNSGRYMAQAVNSHAALVEALELVRRWLPKACIRPDEQRILDVVSHALAQAKAQP